MKLFNQTKKPVFILWIVLAYVLCQFFWWEILLVNQTRQIIEEKQNIIALSVSDGQRLQAELASLRKKQKTKTIMIVGEGLVFLLLLIYGTTRVKRAYEREKELSRQQHNFFLSITHELKTPIAATKLQLQTLRKQNLDAALQDELLQKALQETERLNALIDNVLLASRMDSPGFSLYTQVANATELLKAIVDRYYQKALQEGRLLLETEPEASCLIDEQAFTSVVTNLLSNAFKYAPGNESVHLSLKASKGGWCLRVADKGPGISKAEQEKIFEKFYRAGNEETRRNQGTGLGLYIVKKLVDAHGWSIRVKNENSRGAVFEIEMKHA